MKKLFLLGIAAMLGAMPSAAGGLTAMQALERALEAGSCNGRAVARARAFDAKSMKLVHSGAKLRTSDSAAAYYVFSSGDRGFIIASGDDRVRPVLALADDGTFDAARIPDNLRWWLSQYEAEISALDAAGADAAAISSDNVFENYAAWTPIEPLVKTQWNQLAPYNKLCPTVGGTTCPTGCVATAMAQVINAIGYYGGKGTNTYTPSAVGKPLTFDFASYTPDFSKLLSNYTAAGVQPTDDEVNEVAKLMLACGVAVNTGYNARSSGAGEPVSGLKRFFGYDDSSVTLRRANFTSAEWEGIAYGQLAAGRPLYYGGTGSGSHAFVVDGYLGDGLFHLNWGWGGLSDGYFALSALNPQEQGTGSYAGGYNLGQLMCLFVKPGDPKPDFGEVPTSPARVVYLAGGLAVPSVSGTVDSFDMRCGILSTTDGRSRDIGMSLLLRRADGRSPEIFMTPESYATIQAGGSIWNFKADFSKTSVPPGKYYAYPAYAVRGVDGYWLAEQNGQTLSKMEHWDLTVSESGARSYKIAEAVNPGIELYGMSANELYANDASCHFSALITNSGYDDFGEEMSVRMISADGKSSSTIATIYMNLRAGESLPLDVDFKAPAAGNYTICLYRNKFDLRLGNNGLAVTVNAGKRPAPAAVPGPTGTVEVALWADEGKADVATVAIAAGGEFVATSALCSTAPLATDYYLAFFEHGKADDRPLCRYAVATSPAEAFDWRRGDAFSVKPELAPGVYTWAFTDADDKLLSYTADFLVCIEQGGVSYCPLGNGSDLEARKLLAAPAAELELPATITCGDKEYKVSSVAPGVFAGCTQLAELTLPSTLTALGYDAFRGAIGLRHVYFRGLDVPFANSALPFYGISSEAEMYVPAEAYSGYNAVFHSPCRLYAMIKSLSAPASVAVEEGTVERIALTVDPAEGFNPAFTVKVANPEVVSATASGSVLTLAGLAKGTSTVTLTSVQPGVEPVMVNVTVSEQSSILEVTEQPTAFDVYSLRGECVRRAATTLRGLPAGIYIANGRKILVR